MRPSAAGRGSSRRKAALADVEQKVSRYRLLKFSMGFSWADGRIRTVALVNLAAVMERLDEQTLPSLYSAVSATFQTLPKQLGYLTLCRALVQALTSPLGGMAGECVPKPYCTSTAVN